MQHAASHTTTVQPSSHNQRHILIGKQWLHTSTGITRINTHLYPICCNLSYGNQDSLIITPSRLSLNLLGQLQSPFDFRMRVEIISFGYRNIIIIIDIYMII